MSKRIGFFICHCGVNIAGKVRVEEVTEFVRGLKNVVVARDYKFMCSDPGQEMIEKDIRELDLNRVVVASCTPRLHEKTFQGACQRGGINPYLFQMASVREQVSWVTEDPDAATRKAKTLSAAAVNRVNYHQSLASREVDVHPDVLVVGGGIAGMQASLDIAYAGHKVYLVERQPTIGGHMLQFDKTFPTLDCAACIGTPKMVSVGQDPNIELLTYHEVDEVSGFVGNFKVNVRKKKRYVDVNKCTGCGECAAACVVKNVIQIPERLPLPVMEPEEESALEATLSSHGNQPRDLIAILIDVNDKLRYLPRPVLTNLAYRLDIPLSEVFRVATFYSNFSLVPVGRHMIEVCSGTSCHIRGSKQLINQIRDEIQIDVGETTEDMRFTFRTVNCMGCCALAPAVRVGGETYGFVKATEVPSILKDYL